MKIIGRQARLQRRTWGPLSIPTSQAFFLSGISVFGSSFDRASSCSSLSVSVTWMSTICPFFFPLVMVPVKVTYLLSKGIAHEPGNTEELNQCKTKGKAEIHCFDRNSAAFYADFSNLAFSGLWGYCFLT